MGRKIISILLIVWVMLMMPMTAFAQNFDNDRVGSISLTLKEQDGKTPITGVEFSLYYVATVCINSKNNLSYSFTDAFQDCGCALEDPTLSAKLDTFVKSNSTAAGKLVIDANGNATFTNLKLGMYFVQQTNTVAGYAPCTSFLVMVPNQNGDDFTYDVNASPKTDVEKLTDITIKKVWNTDTTSKAASSVTVQLLRDDVVVETATLSAANSWQVTYSDMPESDAYSIVEVNVPKGFTATYSKNGYVFTVTNTSSLAQTGQLVWPIPLLAMAGLILITIGTIVLRKTRDRNA